MEVLPIRTGKLKAGDELATIIQRSIDLQEGDIIVVSSKAVATVEGAAIKLSSIEPSPEAATLAALDGSDPRHREVVLRECKRMNGSVLRSVHGVVLTELHPAGADGSFLVPNAGIDESNVDEGWVVGWPVDPEESVEKLREQLVEGIEEKEREDDFSISSMPSMPSSSSIAVIISDSCVVPRRSGVTAFALTVSGMDPLLDRRGTKDLFGRAMKITVEAVADQLATAANFVMGNSNQSVPAAVIRDHGLPLSEFSGWVPGIEREKDLYFGSL